MVDQTLGNSYALSIYDDTDSQRCAIGGYSTGCSTSVSIPSTGTRTYTAYVAQDAPAGQAPSNDVRAVKILTIDQDGNVTVKDSDVDADAEIAALILAIPALQDPCVELFPVGPNTNGSSLNDLQHDCEGWRLAGLSGAGSFGPLPRSSARAATRGTTGAHNAGPPWTPSAATDRRTSQTLRRPRMTQGRLTPVLRP